MLEPIMSARHESARSVVRTESRLLNAGEVVRCDAEPAALDVGTADDGARRRSVTVVMQLLTELDLGLELVTRGVKRFELASADEAEAVRKHL